MAITFVQADLRVRLARMRYRTSDGWSVEVVSLTGTPDHHDGTWIRISYCGSWVTDVRTPEELARYIPLEDLEEALTPRCAQGPTLLRVGLSEIISAMIPAEGTRHE
jgi:hypothetical protein